MNKSHINIKIHTKSFKQIKEMHITNKKKIRQQIYEMHLEIVFFDDSKKHFYNLLYLTDFKSYKPVLN